MLKKENPVETQAKGRRTNVKNTKLKKCFGGSRSKAGVNLENSKEKGRVKTSVTTPGKKRAKS